MVPEPEREKGGGRREKGGEGERTSSLTWLRSSLSLVIKTMDMDVYHFHCTS